MNTNKGGTMTATETKIEELEVELRKLKAQKETRQERLFKILDTACDGIQAEEYCENIACSTCPLRSPADWRRFQKKVCN